MKNDKFIIFKLLLTLLVVVIIHGCAPLRPVIVDKKESINGYKYFYITSTNSLVSGSGATISGQYYSSSKTVNPSDVITGVLIKEGLIRIPDIKPELSNETLIINYGESGRRNRGLGYTIEVTIQFVSANTSLFLCSCTAEGQGSTEADDVRHAISRCLAEIIPKK